MKLISKPKTLLFARKVLEHKVSLVNPSEHFPLLETHGKAGDLAVKASSKTLQILFLSLSLYFVLKH